MDATVTIQQIADNDKNPRGIRTYLMGLYYQGEEEPYALKKFQVNYDGKRE